MKIFDFEYLDKEIFASQNDEISLHDKNICDSHVFTLITILKFKMINKLNLKNNNLSDFGIITILMSLMQLKYLNVVGNITSDELMYRLKSHVWSQNITIHYGHRDLIEHHCLSLSIIVFYNSAWNE